MVQQRNEQPPANGDPLEAWSDSVEIAGRRSQKAAPSSMNTEASSISKAGLACQKLLMNAPNQSARTACKISIREAAIANSRPALAC